MNTYREIKGRRRLALFLSERRWLGSHERLGRKLKKAAHKVERRLAQKLLAAEEIQAGLLGLTDC